MCSRDNRKYFAERSHAVSFHRGNGGAGLRKAQYGAIHAIAAHFTTSSRPAVVSMPTGSGKTEVMILAPFVLRAERVLVMSSGRLICDQLEEKFATHSILPEIGALDLEPDDTPEVIQIPRRRTEEDSWEELEDYDVAVGTPHRTAPTYRHVEEPPDDLFDLVVVDEAHHSPAKTWKSVIDSFPGARKLLFTATPFRRDGRKIPGEVIYHYPLKQAVEDGIFSELEFIDVQRHDETELDVTLAKKAEEILQRDRDAGLNHHLIARAARRRTCDQLSEIYEEETSLSMRVLHSKHSQTHARRTIELLEDGELDGIICADMLGEGFDFPNLKIAAVHEPYRTVAPTLQFIGRFARVNAPDIGTAKFIAAPQHIDGEVDKLFERDAGWSELVPQLLDRAVTREVERDDVAKNFAVERSSGSITEDLSIYGLTPFFHVKCFRLRNDGETVQQFAFSDWKVAQESVMDGERAWVLLLESSVQPKWTRQASIQNRLFALVIVYSPQESDLLFVCSSEKQARLYEDIQNAFASEDETKPVPLAGSEVKAAYNLLNDIDFFNVGMRSYLSRGDHESYRILTGSKADRSVSENDAMRFHGGHQFGKGEMADEMATLGVSSSGKIWSSNRGGIDQLLSWCDQLNEAITTAGDVVTDTNLDVLREQEPVSSFPEPSENVINVSWPNWVFEQAPCVRMDTGNGPKTACALDFDIEADFSRGDSTGSLTFYGDDFSFSCALALQSNLLRVSQEAQIDIEKEGQERWREFSSVFSDDSFVIQFADFSQLEGGQYVEYPSDTVRLRDGAMEVSDWAGATITLEEPSDDDRVSIHEFFQERLCEECDGCVIYDQGNGELADFVTIDRDGEMLNVVLYHCKSSASADPGARVADFDEVCGQTLRSLKFLRMPGRFFSRLEDRLSLQNGDEKIIMEGNLDLSQLLADGWDGSFEPNIVIVQPGLSKSGISDRLHLLLGAVDGHVREDIGKGVKILCSE